MAGAGSKRERLLAGDWADNNHLLGKLNWHIVLVVVDFYRKNGVSNYICN
jgi:hypothetical protein